ncbi:hypothetical protein [Colwellia psychrerythraea]|uniref:Uncharacterized protein n=1 Tax=Colwellia psychrerythraea TaxID=28229 RepID=A0A099KFH1_COLPS|nr:hypothetical protein [Colwellia psychrerythraea]KGJ89514.1 hypothetical protein GAB14E_0707 [Colwellia psychrerythraea]
MVQQESDIEKRIRELKELEGKNIAHYSVMMSTFISSRIDANKAIFTFSSAGIGLLVTLISEPNSTISVVLFSSAILAFVIAVISTLFIYIAHTNAIESYIRNEGSHKRDLNLKEWVYVNYIAFSFGVVFVALFAFLKLYGV